MNIYTVSSIAAFVVSFFLSLFVYLKGIQDKCRKAIIPIIICAGTWCLFPFFSSIGWPEKSLFFTRLIYIAAIFTAPAFLNFGLTILDIEKELKEIFINAGFKENELKTQYEQQGIMQYVIATGENGK